jgi:L-ascorbate metabolism protein UlaG (beta-lactamase superfamily)
MSPTTITYIGGPTALLEIGGLRLLTDPTFDPAPGDYQYLHKVQSPALQPEDLPAIEAILSATIIMRIISTAQAASSSLRPALS